MRIYAAFQASRAVGLVALAAGMVLSNGWQSVAIAVAILAGSVVLFSYIVILATGERPATPPPGWAREPIAARQAAVTEPRREITPAPAPAPQRTPARPRTLVPH